MKIHDVEQGTLAWVEARLGIPTSSNFHMIVTPKGAFSTQSRGYAHRLIAEKLLNRQLDSIDHLEYVSRGKEYEPEAARAYEFEQECELRSVGFITTDDGRMGCSPDRLIVGKPGALEIKCPAPHTHVGYMIDGFEDKYTPQVQGQMLVGEFEFVDRYSYSPEMPSVRVRTYRDEWYIKTLSGALNEFCDALDQMMETVKSRGFFVERKVILTAHEEAYGGEIGQ